MQLILFDIDGTILHTHGLSKDIFCQALSDVFEREILWQQFPYNGQTDYQLALDLLELDGVSAAEADPILPAAFKRMAAIWETHIPYDGMHVYAGVRELIVRLSKRDDVLLGILTSNTRPTAICKLRAAEIDPAYFPIGAFGDEARARQALPQMALDRATMYAGHLFAGDDLWLIGDSPIDINCAHEVGGRVLSVATSKPAELLADHHPDILLDDLSDVDRVMRILLDR